MRINRLAFRSPGVGGHAIDLDPGRVIVFVGPNNAGKSTALRELAAWSRGESNQRMIFQDIGWERPDSVEACLELLRPIETTAPAGQPKQDLTMWIQPSSLSGGDQAYRLDTRQFGWLLPDRSDQADAAVRQHLLEPLTIRLDGRTRFSLSDPQTCGDLQQKSNNHLGTLFRDRERRKEVRRLIARAFRFGPRYFVIEYVGDGSLRVRLSSREPEDEDEELGITTRARAFHAAAPLLTEQGDGVRAYAGLISALVSMPHATMLVDEPEAFLHPTLARRLGEDLARLAATRATTLVAATHSPEFLMGCVNAGVPVTVVRLAFDGASGSGRASHLPGASLQSLMADPLLRSTGALDGLFHRSVVVTEADADRAFYDEINNRLVSVQRGASDTLFVNAQNWQTIERVVRPLRALGIPAAAVLDLDAIVEAGAAWSKLLDAIGAHGEDRALLQSRLNRCRAHAKALEEEHILKRKGVGAFHGEGREEVDSLVAELAAYGVFLVPIGELECWLGSLGVQGPKSRWIVRMFERLGSDVSSPEYAHPGTNDVWAFCERIAGWLDHADSA